MILVNALEKSEVVSPYAYAILIRLVAPFAPHLAEELWELLGHHTSIHLESWPLYDETVLTRASVTLAVQVNGKLRGTFVVQPGAIEPDVIREAKQLPAVAEWLQGKTIVREIYVTGRLVNFVVQ